MCCALLGTGLALAWLFLLPVITARYLRSRTGFDVKVQQLRLNPFMASLTVRGLLITNPPTFPEKDFVEVREFSVNTRLLSVFRGRLVVDDVVVNVAAITMVRDNRGLVNARVFQEGFAGPPQDRPTSPPKETKEREFLIKHLNLRFDRLVVADYSQRQPTRREYDINLSHTYENVTSVKQIIMPLGGAYATLTGAVGLLLPDAGTALKSADEAFKGTGKTATETVKGLFEALEKSLKK